MNENLFQKLTKLKDKNSFIEFEKSFALTYQTKQGNNLLHLALLSRNWKFSWYLYEKGFDLFHKNKSGIQAVLYLFNYSKDDIHKQTTNKYKKNLETIFFDQLKNNLEVQEKNKDILNQFFWMQRKKDFNLNRHYIYINLIHAEGSGMLNYPIDGGKLLEKLERENFIYLKENYKFYFKNFKKIAETSSKLSDNEADYLLGKALWDKSKELNLENELFFAILSFRMNMKDDYLFNYFSDKLLYRLEQQQPELQLKKIDKTLYDFKKWKFPPQLTEKDRWETLRTKVISQWEFKGVQPLQESSIIPQKEFKSRKL